MTFGWAVRTIDGHSLSEVAETLEWAQGVTETPQAIIAKTIKGKGVKLLEEAQHKWHGKPIPPEEEARALADIGVNA
jgi:transketolase